jgi:thiopurine S-methyltransferase
MDHEFWRERWRLGQIGFHQQDYNAHLIRHWPALGVPAGGRVFVPLCGKSRDMLWLANAGYKVLGIELEALAIEAFFGAASAPYSHRQHGRLSMYEGLGVNILCGDFFDVAPDDLVGTQGVFDRGALVALPRETRRRYVDHLLAALPVGARILLLTIEYDQSLVDGPPFSVLRPEVESLYGARCAITRMETATTDQVPPHFQRSGITQAGESSYRIVKEH